MSDEYRQEVRLDGAFERYIKENLSIRLSIDEPGYYENKTVITVELLLAGEVIDSASDYVYIPS